MNGSVRVACVQAEPVVLRPRRDDRQARRARARGGRRRRQARALPRDVRARVSVEPLGARARARQRRARSSGRGSRASRSTSRPEPNALAAAARDAGIWLAVGVNELERGTIYNSPAPLRARRHARAAPPQARADEPRAAGLGPGRRPRARGRADAAGLVGGLICWENLMPLARFALYERGVEIYLAPTADDSEGWHDSLRHIARESRAFVLSCCVFQSAAGYPADVPLAAGDELLGRGGSAIVAPDGTYLAGPLWDEEGILFADLEPAVLYAARQRFDPAGHYHRPDVLSLTVTPQQVSSALRRRGGRDRRVDRARAGAARLGCRPSSSSTHRDGPVGLRRRHAPHARRARRRGVVHGERPPRPHAVARARRQSTGMRIWEGVGLAWFARRGRRLRGGQRPRPRAARDPARVARTRRGARAVPLARRRRTARRALGARRRRAARAPGHAAARRGRRAPRRRALQGPRVVPSDDRPADVVVWACGAWLPQLFPEHRRRSRSRGATSSSSAATRPGAEHPASSSTTPASTATATSGGSGSRSRPTRRANDRPRHARSHSVARSGRRRRARTRPGASRRSPARPCSAGACASTTSRPTRTSSSTAIPSTTVVARRRRLRAQLQARPCARRVRRRLHRGQRGRASRSTRSARAPATRACARAAQLEELWISSRGAGSRSSNASINLRSRSFSCFCSGFVSAEAKNASLRPCTLAAVSHASGPPP